MFTWEVGYPTEWVTQPAGPGVSFLHVYTEGGVTRLAGVSILPVNAEVGVIRALSWGEFSPCER